MDENYRMQEFLIFSLTENERRSILRVLDRDDQEASIEDMDFIEEEKCLEDIEKKSVSNEAEGKNKNLCCRCGIEKSCLEIIFQSLKICPLCKRQVCTSCMKLSSTCDLCIYCFKLVEMRKKWGVWFLEDVKTNEIVGCVSGSKVLRKYLSKPPNYIESMPIQRKPVSLRETGKNPEDFRKSSRGRSLSLIENQSDILDDQMSSNPHLESGGISTMQTGLNKNTEDSSEFFGRTGLDLQSPSIPDQSKIQHSVDSQINRLVSGDDFSNKNSSYKRYIAGNIQLCCNLTYGSQLIVTINNVVGLVPPKSASSVNAYIKCELLHGNDILKKFSSEIFYDSGVPEWNDKYTFNIYLLDESFSLKIFVMEGGPKRHLSKLLKGKNIVYGVIEFSYVSDREPTGESSMWRTIIKAFQDGISQYLDFTFPLPSNEIIEIQEVEEKESFSMPNFQSEISQRVVDNSNIGSSVFAVDQTDGELGSPFGVLTYGIHYNKSSENLVIFVKNANGIVFLDDRLSGVFFSALIHPYNQICKTNLFKKSYQPDWNERLKINLSHSSMIAQTLYFEISIVSYLKNKSVVGRLCILLEDFFKKFPDAYNKEIILTQPLSVRYPSTFPGPKGLISFALRFDLISSSASVTMVNLELKILIGTELVTQREINGEMSYYATAELLPDRRKKYKKESDYAKTQSPEWNYNCAWYSIPLQDLKTFRCLEIAVWMKQNSDDFVGGIRLGPNPPISQPSLEYQDSTPEETNIWLNSLSTFGVWNYYTLHLRSTLIPRNMFENVNAINDPSTLDNPSLVDKIEISAVLEYDNIDNPSFKIKVEVKNTMCSIQPNICKICLRRKGAGDKKQSIHLFPQEYEHNVKCLSWNSIADFYDIHDLSEICLAVRFYHQPYSKSVAESKLQIIKHNMVGFIVLSDPKLITPYSNYIQSCDGLFWNSTVSSIGRNQCSTIMLRNPFEYDSIFVCEKSIFNVKKSLPLIKTKESSCSKIDNIKTSTTSHQINSPFSNLIPHALLKKLDSLPRTPCPNENRKTPPSVQQSAVTSPISPENIPKPGESSPGSKLEHSEAELQFEQMPDDAHSIDSSIPNVHEDCDDSSYINEDYESQSHDGISHEPKSKNRTYDVFTSKMINCVKKTMDHIKSTKDISSNESSSCESLAITDPIPVITPPPLNVDSASAQISLYYSVESFTLHIVHLSFKNLPQTENHKLYDCFFSAALLPEYSDEMKKRSPVIKSNMTPVWQNSVEFFIYPRVLQNMILMIRLYHQKLPKSLSLGQFYVSFKDISHDTICSPSGVELHFFLHPKEDIVHSAIDFYGELLVHLSLSTRTQSVTPMEESTKKSMIRSKFNKLNSIKSKLSHQYDSQAAGECSVSNKSDSVLSVEVLQCRDLPFYHPEMALSCKIILLPDQNEKQKVSTVKGSLVPSWNERISFDIQKSLLLLHGFSFEIHNSDAKIKSLISVGRITPYDRFEAFDSLGERNSYLWNEFFSLADHSNLTIIVPLCRHKD